MHWRIAQLDHMHWRIALHVLRSVVRIEDPHRIASVVFLKNWSAKENWISGPGLANLKSLRSSTSASVNCSFPFYILHIPVSKTGEWTIVAVAERCCAVTAYFEISSSNILRTFSVVILDSCSLLEKDLYIPIHPPPQVYVSTEKFLDWKFSRKWSKMLLRGIYS